MSTLYLLRHGESFANKINSFSGWIDVGLTPKGISEAQNTGRLLRDIKFNAVYTSNLSRALMTAMIILSENTKTLFPIVEHKSNKKLNKYSQCAASTKKIITKVIQDERLNERFYGLLQGRKVEEGLDYLKDDTGSLWSVSFSEISSAEKLKDTIKRTGSFLNEILIPELSKGKNIMVVSHGTCIGTLLTHIKNIDIDEIRKTELPNGKPMAFSYSARGFKQQKY